MNILGIQYDSHPFCHDTAAALIVDQHVIGILEEERFTRVKHAVGQFPIHAIKELLAKAKIDFNKIDKIAVSTENSILCIKKQLHEYFQFDDQILSFATVDHHVSHILDSYFYSQFYDCIALVIDGQGCQNDSITIAQVIDGKIEILRKFDISKSLGYMYELASIWCGLGKWGCGKLMGLAAFGKTIDIQPYFSFDGTEFIINESYRIAYDFIRLALQKDSKAFDSYLQKFYALPELNCINQLEKATIVSMFKFFESIYPYELCKDSSSIIYYASFAATIQHIFEQSVCHLAEIAKQLATVKSRNLLLAGGCIQNCSANNAIANLNLFSSIYCSPTPYDSGCALGNALACNMRTNQKIYGIDVHSFPAYAGKTYGLDDISFSRDDIEISHISNDDIAHDLKDGKIIGWFQNGSEIGPRALCHRSILANPAIRSNLYKINSRIKGRQQFRPLAPVVRDIDFFDVFDTTSSDMAQFMLRTVKIKKQYAKKLNAVHHIDGTSRPQFLQQKTNPEVYDLISIFHSLTGIPGLLNTSFNRNNEPIVESIDDAIRMLLATPDLDYIVFNSNIKISRKHQ